MATARLCSSRQWSSAASGTAPGGWSGSGEAVTAGVNGQAAVRDRRTRDRDCG